jgi:membrane protein required for colicin V production
VNGFDVAVLAVLLVAGLLGLTAGLVRLALSLASIAVGAAASYTLAEPLAAQLRGWVGSPGLALGLAAALAFTSTLLAFSLLAWLLRASLSRLGLGWVDRLLGASLALAVALLLLVSATLAMERLAPRAPLLAGSGLRPFLAALGDDLARRLPDAWRHHGRRLVETAGERLERAPRPPRRDRPERSRAPRDEG